MNTHKYNDEGVCTECWEGRESHVFPDDPELTEACEECCGPEDLSMWCGPGESVEDMLHRAAERD